MSLIFLILESFIFGVAITWIFEQILKDNKKLRAKYYRHHEILFGFHVHHSIYGLVAIIISLFYFFINNGHYGIFWFVLGFGIIFEHTLSDGRFVFIEKQKNN